jgi:hypothetical protein
MDDNNNNNNDKLKENNPLKKILTAVFKKTIDVSTEKNEELAATNDNPAIIDEQTNVTAESPTNDPSGRDEVTGMERAEATAEQGTGEQLEFEQNMTVVNKLLGSATDIIKDIVRENQRYKQELYETAVKQKEQQLANQLAESGSLVTGSDVSSPIIIEKLLTKTNEIINNLFSGKFPTTTVSGNLLNSVAGAKELGRNEVIAPLEDTVMNTDSSGRNEVIAPLDDAVTDTGTAQGTEANVSESEYATSSNEAMNAPHTQIEDFLAKSNDMIKQILEISVGTAQRSPMTLENSKPNKYYLPLEYSVNVTNVVSPVNPTIYTQIELDNNYKKTLPPTLKEIIYTNVNQSEEAFLYEHIPYFPDSKNQKYVIVLEISGDDSRRKSLNSVDGSRRSLDDTNPDFKTPRLYSILLQVEPIMMSNNNNSESFATVETPPIATEPVPVPSPSAETTAPTPLTSAMDETHSTTPPPQTSEMDETHSTTPPSLTPAMNEMTMPTPLTSAMDETPSTSAETTTPPQLTPEMKSDNDINQKVTELIKSANLTEPFVSEPETEPNNPGDKIDQTFLDTYKDFISKFRTIDTIGDGTCLIHAILSATSSAYRSLSRTDKLTIGQAFRTSLSTLDYADEKRKYNLDKTEYDLFKKENMNRYLSEKSIGYLCQKYKFNVFMFEYNPTSQTIGSTTVQDQNIIRLIEGSTNENMYPWISIYCRNPTHYSVIKMGDTYALSTEEANPLKDFIINELSKTESKMKCEYTAASPNIDHYNVYSEYYDENVMARNSFFADINDPTQKYAIYDIPRYNDQLKCTEIQLISKDDMENYWNKKSIPNTEDIITTNSSEISTKYTRIEYDDFIQDP